MREPGMLSLTIPSLVFLSAGFKLSHFPKEFSDGLQQKIHLLFGHRCLHLRLHLQPVSCNELSLQVHIQYVSTPKCFPLPQLSVSFLDMFFSAVAAFLPGLSLLVSSYHLNLSVSQPLATF